MPKLGNCWAAAIISSLAIALPISGYAATAQADAAASQWWDRFLDEGHLVVLRDQRRMEVYCQGAGAPTVVLAAGLGDGPWAWRFVQADLARSSRTCVFSRAGIGRSDPGKAPRDAGAAASDLEDLLAAARIEGPYVLVGHSMASFALRLFSAQHLENVVGMVLVDPSAEGQEAAFQEISPQLASFINAYQLGLAACANATLSRHNNCSLQLPADATDRARTYIAQMPSSVFYETLLSEIDVLRMGDAQLPPVRSGTLGAIPLVVLTASQVDMPGIDDEQRMQIQQWRRQAHLQLAGLSTSGRRIEIQGVGHNIQIDRPAAVIEVIREVVKASRHNTPTATR